MPDVFETKQVNHISTTYSSTAQVNPQQSHISITNNNVTYLYKSRKVLKKLNHRTFEAN